MSVKIIVMSTTKLICLIYMYVKETEYHTFQYYENRIISSFLLRPIINNLFKNLMRV